MNKLRYMGAISTLAWLLAIALVSAQDVLKTDAQDFEVRKRNACGLCGNLKVLCGSVFAEGDTNADLNEVQINGETTVEKALEKVMQENPRYQWSVEDGVINITPKKEYRHLKNGKDPLDTIIKDFRINDETVLVAPYMLCEAAGLNCIPREYAGIRQLCNKISLQLNKVTLRTALNKIIKADGMASWKLEYSGKDNHPTIDIHCWRPGRTLIEEDTTTLKIIMEAQQQPIENKISEAEQPTHIPYWLQLLLFAGLLIFYFIVRAFRAKIKPSR